MTLSFAVIGIAGALLFVGLFHFVLPALLVFAAVRYHSWAKQRGLAGFGYWTGQTIAIGGTFVASLAFLYLFGVATGMRGW
jgi:hypothetical protein